MCVLLFWKKRKYLRTNWLANHCDDKRSSQYIRWYFWIKIINQICAHQSSILITLGKSNHLQKAAWSHEVNKAADVNRSISFSNSSDRMERFLCESILQRFLNFTRMAESVYLYVNYDCTATSFNGLTKRTWEGLVGCFSRSFVGVSKSLKTYLYSLDSRSRKFSRTAID